MRMTDDSTQPWMQQQLEEEEEEEEGGCSSVSVRVGFRTAELVQQPLDEAWADIAAHFLPSVNDSTQQVAGAAAQLEGESFYFRVNGVPVYARGANLIPLHVLHERVTPAAVRTLVLQAAAAHMNMIRVW
jgi:beta-mannosidase